MIFISSFSIDIIELIKGIDIKHKNKAKEDMIYIFFISNTPYVSFH